MKAHTDRNYQNRKAPLAIGLLAHVDAGKTTLSEAILYYCGKIKKPGRVDHKDAFLDHDPIERERGITIFSKCAAVELGGRPVTLLDTPGHADLSAETERALSVMDYAVLIISGPDGIKNHTRTLWELLEKYEVPAFIFVNKMDRAGAEKAAIVKELQAELDTGCLDFSAYKADAADPAADPELREEIAFCDEAMLARYENGEKITSDDIAGLIQSRRVFPCFFGSALKNEGVDVFLEAVTALLRTPPRGEDFGARVFKIGEDERGARLAFLKIAGGTLRVRDTLTDAAGKAQKVSQIRIYSGAQYETADEAPAGVICAVTGLAGAQVGDGYGTERSGPDPFLMPVFSRAMRLPDGVAAGDFYRKLIPFAEEDPLLSLSWDEEREEIGVRLMGDVQIEILTRRIADRFGVDVTFGPGSIVYKETIAAPVTGIGHYEPLRHYAEVHLLLEPGAPGSGMVFAADCAQEMLDLPVQQSILTHLREKTPPGVLTGSALTDMKVTLIGGRSHAKHSEITDFKEAASRALRQGLMRAENILLEPVCAFVLTVPQELVGKCMAALKAAGADFTLSGAGTDRVRLRGEAPAGTLSDYAARLPGETAGQGELSYRFAGYRPCEDAGAVIEAAGYDAEADLSHPAGSVFCSHGTADYANWREVEERAHVQLKLAAIAGTPEWIRAQEAEAAARQKPAADAARAKTREDGRPSGGAAQRSAPSAFSAEDQELQRIFEQTYGSGSGSEAERMRRMQESAKRIGTPQTESVRDGEVCSRGADSKSAPVGRETVKNTHAPGNEGAHSGGTTDAREHYLIVDGYNIIHAWPELIRLAEDGLDAPRSALNGILSNYQGYIQARVIVVYDAWKVKGGIERVYREGNIDIVFTKEAETADAYIEKVTHELAKRYDVTVATSDGAEQMIIWGHGAKRLPALELKADIEKANIEIAAFLKERRNVGNRLFDSLDADEAARIEQIRLGKSEFLKRQT